MVKSRLSRAAVALDALMREHRLTSRMLGARTGYHPNYIRQMRGGSAPISERTLKFIRLLIKHDDVAGL